MHKTTNFLLLLLFLGYISFAQKGSLRVLDSKSKEPIAFAHCRFYSQDSSKVSNTTTDINGFVRFDFKSKMNVCISYMGYENLISTVKPDSQFVFYLKPTILNLDQVVITGQYTPEGTDKSIYKIKVIDAADIQLRGSNNLEDVLNSESNMQIRQDGIFGSNLNMQGVGGENIKILVDGVPLIGRMDGQLDLSQINMNNVERIEIVEGPMSVNYGSNALGGVINIITKSHVNGSKNISLKTYYESVGKFNNDIDMGFSKGKNTFMLSGGRNFSDGFDISDSARNQMWKPKEQYFGRFRFKRQIGTTSLRLTAEYFHEFVLDKGTPELAPDVVNHYYYYKAHDGFYYTDRANTQLSWTGVLFKKSFFNFMASNSYYNRQRETKIKNLYTQDYTNSTASGDHDTSVFNTILIKGEFSRFVKDSVKFNYQLGFEINDDYGFGKKIENQEQRIDDYAIYGGIKYNINKDFVFQPALRWSYNTKYKAPLVPSLNLKYDFKNRLQMRLSYAKGFRAPSLKEMYLDFKDANHAVFGNQNIEAEKSDNLNFNISFTQTNGQHSIRYDGDLFYNDIKDMIELFPQFVVSGGDTAQIYTYGNIDRHLSQGGRFNLHYKRISSYEFKLSMAVIGEKSFSNGEQVYETNMNYHPEISTTAKYIHKKSKLNVICVYKYTGKTIHDALDQSNNFISYTDASYHMLDLSASRAFWNERFNLIFGVKNLLNVTNIRSSGASTSGVHGNASTSIPIGMGRTYFVSLTYKFEN